MIGSTAKQILWEAKNALHKSCVPAGKH